jgi:hypothetical protein
VTCKEQQPLPRCERRDLRLTSVVVQSSDPRWMAAPHRPQVPGQPGRLDRQLDAVRSAVPPKDDIAGWLDKLLVDPANLRDRTLDTGADTRRPSQRLPSSP